MLIFDLRRKKNLSRVDKKRFYLTLSFPPKTMKGGLELAPALRVPEPVAVASKGRSLHHSG